MSRLESAAILQSLGFVPDHDFTCSQTAPTNVQITWLSAQAQPSDATLNAVVWDTTIEAQWQARRDNSMIGKVIPIRLAATVNNSTVSLADVGLRWQLDANRHYGFSFIGAYTAAATTTGLGLAVNGPASPVLVRMVVNIAEVAASQVSILSGSYGYLYPLG